MPSSFQVTATPIEEDQAHHQDNNKNNNATSYAHPLLGPPETSNITSFSAMPTFPMTSNPNPVVLPLQIESPMENLSLGRGNQAISPSTNLIRPIPFDLDLNSKSTDDPSPLSLKLSLPSDHRESSSRHSAFQAMSTSFSGGDSIIIVV